MHSKVLFWNYGLLRVAYVLSADSPTAWVQNRVPILKVGESRRAQGCSFSKQNHRVTKMVISRFQLGTISTEVRRLTYPATDLPWKHSPNTVF